MALAPISAVSLEWMIFAITSIFVGTRIYIRAWQNRTFEAIDGLICFTWSCFVVTATCDTVMVASGFKDPTLSFTLGDPHGAFAEFSKQKLKRILMILYASSMPYYTSLWGVKFTLILLYYNVFASAFTKFRMVLHLVTTFVVLTFLVVILMNIFYCWPIGLNWDVDNLNASCITYFTYDPYIVALSFHISSEIFIFSMFYPILRVLKRSPSYDKAMPVLFFVGFMGVVVTICRTAFLFTTTSQPVISTAQTLAALEQGVGLTVVCLPGLRRVVQRRFSVRTKSISLGSQGAKHASTGSVKERDLEPGVVEKLKSGFREHTFGTAEPVVFATIEMDEISIADRPQLQEVQNHERKPL